MVDSGTVIRSRFSSSAWLKVSPGWPPAVRLRPLPQAWKLSAPAPQTPPAEVSRSAESSPKLWLRT